MTARPAAHSRSERWVCFEGLPRLLLLLGRACDWHSSQGSLGGARQASSQTWY